jgi:hypothetical protein
MISWPAGFEMLSVDVQERKATINDATEFVAFRLIEYFIGQDVSVKTMQRGGIGGA